MGYCIVPDIHGRGFWKPLIEKVDDYDKIVFLGDYLDPYVGYDHITKGEALYNFIEILDFKRKNNDKVGLVLGNHDLHYLPGISEDWGCRRDDERYKTIQTLFLENIDMFKMCYIIQTKDYGKVLLSHAGINNGWYKKEFNGDKAEFVAEVMNESVSNFSQLKHYAWQIGYSRGGDDKYGSIVWSDLYDHNEESTGKANEKLGVVYQIFGHTYGFPSTEEIFECKSYSMIDNKQLFFIE